MTHYHVGHNVSGYLPESDDDYEYDSYDSAKKALADELAYAADDEENDQRFQELQEARWTVLNSSGRDFLIYTSTHAESDHDLPTAWWIQECTEA